LNCLGFLFLDFSDHFLEKLAYDGELLGGTDFCARGEDAKFGVGGYLFYGFDGFGSGVAMGGGFGEIEASDLKAVE
jgi:hypothetical protein